MQKYYNKKRKLNKLKSCLLLLMMVCFAGVAQAQTATVLMKDGNYTIQRNTGTINFYDSHGPSQQTNYWETWYAHNENFTFVFKPAVNGDKIKVTFNPFAAYAEPADPNSAVGDPIGNWTLRLNDDVLKIYQGNGVVEANLITELTGNSQLGFSVMTDGPMTFQFSSNGQYREEGWYATVELVTTAMAPQAPFIQRATCSDMVEIFPTTLGARIIYSIGDNDPEPADPLAPPTYEYTGPISFPEETIPSTGFKVNAMSQLPGGTGWSSVSHVTFQESDRVPIPDADDDLDHTTITRVDGTNTIVMTPAGRPSGLNDTYQVRYTMSTNGTEPADPTYNNSTAYTGPITVTVNGTIFKAKTFAVSCYNQYSVDAVRYEVEGIYAPAPVIDFDAMTITAAEGETTFDILYTLDGSIPSVDPITGTYSAGTVNLSGLTPGQTVRAIAYRANNDTGHTANSNYTPSQVVTAIYVPSSGSGTYGGVVLLDDREDHTWAYYSNENSPIKSLNPADVKITYTGYGTNTKTTTNTDLMPVNSAFDGNVAAGDVAVNIDAPENQFIYLKTLEAANEDGTGNYPYTMIPNPFLVRPTGQSNGTGSITPTTRTITLSYQCYQNGYGGSLEFTYVDGTGSHTETININSSSATSTTRVVNVDTEVSFRLRAGGNRYYVQFTAQYDDNLGTTQIASSGWYSSTSWSSYGPYTVSATSTTITYGIYRGFYAWRVKSLSSGLTIQDPETKATYGVNSIIYADQEVEFVTDKQEGNEVEFEALWAQALLNSDGYYTNSGKYKNAYERNFKRVTSLNTYSGPVTISSIYPDGSETSVRSVSRTSNYSCSDDVKLENMTLSMANYYLDGNNHSLIVGRGVANGNNNVASAVYGEYQPGTTKNDFEFRVESGRYGSIYGLYDDDGTTHITNSFKSTITYGSDYDRAKKNHTKLIVANATQLGRSVSCADNTVNETVLSGTFGNNATDDIELYMGWAGTIGDNSLGTRKLEVFDGIFKGGIAGGIEQGVAEGTMILTMRIHGGTVSRYVYQSGQYSPAYGSRKTIITGGTFEDWIAGGCYGTGENTNTQRTGVTNGNVYIYFGGNAKQTDTEGIFGAGYGNYATATGYYTVVKSFIVVADEATTAGSVYGGGNNGYNTSDAEVWVLGGGKNTLTVSGSVFGGANKARSSATTTVTMENGTVNGSMYGGANTSGAVAQLATVKMSGGTVKGSVYGGGKGSGTTMSNNTKVTVTEGTINGNIYGGGEEGIVSGNTTVSFEGGSVTDVYGAGKGSSSQRANVAQGTTVNVKGGVVNGAVYGGGENGTVAYNANGNSSNYGSTVSITGGEVKGDVFGGGKLGTTQGKTTVNISGTWDGTIIRENVFAGAYGQQGSIYVAGLKTLNISGGRIYGSVYGGSRNANDGNTLNATGGTDATSITNISGGRIDQHVYAAGYYGSTKGSVYAFIGLSAINEAPHHVEGYNGAKGSILIGGTVWAGGDWGVFSGTFGAPTISGNSNIYINGEGYSTDGNDQSATNYMNLQGSIMGSGSSCDAGEGERNLILSHYGADVANSGSDVDINPFSHASRQVNSIQRFHNVIFDDAHLGFVGQGKINSLNTTEKYALYEIDQNVYLANGSTMVMNVPSSQLYSFHSVTIDDAYTDAASAYHVVPYNGLGATGSATDNKIRVNGGSYVEIKYVPESTGGNEPGEEGTVTVDFETGDLSQLTNTTSGISYSNDATYPWEITTASTNGGTYSMKSSNEEVGSSTGSITVTAEFVEDGSISFYGRASCENTTSSDWDNGRFYIDGTRQVIIQNSANFSQYTYEVAAGSHTFRWEYKKDGSVNSNDDCFYVDDIVFTGVHTESASSGDDPTYTDAYGELSGYAHMMAGNPSNDATCAYARPKQSQEQGNILPASASDYFHNDNGNWTSLAADGGFVSYRGEDNDYTIAGVLVNNGNSDQLRYENHYPGMTRSNSEYYRIWRHGGNHHTVEAVVTAEAEGSEGEFKTVEVEVQLPSWGMAGSYYRFDRTETGEFTIIDYGPDVMTYNGANYSNPLDDNTWMYYDGTAQQTGVTASNATVAAALGTNGIMSNPNLNFGLVLKPGQTMKDTDANYIINSDSDPYLASVEKPFNCDDNLHMPTMKLVLTYSDELSANATLEPVHIYLVQCNSEGTITDYVDIVLTINTSTQITSGFKTQIYARMDGSINTRETSTATVVLPTFNVAESGEMAQFYLQKVEFKQEDGVVIESSHGSSVVCAETVESTGSYAVPLNIDRFAMTIAAQPNPDNTDDWRDVTGPQDAVQPSGTYNYNHLLWTQSNNRGVHLGDGKGRSPLSLGFTLYYNSNEIAPAKSKIGDLVFTIEVRNIEGGEGQYTSKTFTVTVQVYRVGPGANFYVDGINGQDLNDENRAKFPDKAAKTVNFILNRLGYMPGDNIIVVNELPINKVTTWDGTNFQNNVKIYRYPGGHNLSAADAAIIGNENNDPYMGQLVDVTKTLNMKGVIMDGMYAEATAPVNGVHNSALYPTEGTGLGNCTFDGKANAPLITISNGARVNMTNCKLQNNYNNNAQSISVGGAVHVSYEGILAMNVNNRITGNYNAKGGGVYVDGSMIVSDYAYIWDNYTEAVSNGKADPEQNNVELEDVTEGTFRVVQIGTADSNDAYDELVQTDNEGETKIGVSKDDWDHAYDGYMPVVYAESGTLSYLNNPYNTQSMVVHDGNIFKLERYTSSEYNDSPNYLYWLGTWVTAVTEQPDDFNKDQIDTPEELAWAISLVNGENGCTPAPNTSFTLTGDIDMSENIWVPIGNETTLYNGNFNGNGHVVTGLRGTITRTDMGMFGRTNTNANIHDMVVSTKFNTNSDNLGTVVGNMTGGTVSNVEGAGENTSRNSSATNGGLVGINGGTIHSSFAVTTITGGHDMGGLVAINNGDLINAYSAAEISGGTNMAGLVAANNGRVENCYNATNADVAFAVSNKGSIKYCYTAEAGEGETITYVSDASDDAVLEKHGTYGAVLGRKVLGYMYGDNKVTANGNSYVKTTHEYLNNHTVVWNGLLSVLNQWVADGHTSYSTWYRPTTNTINGDLPVLAFPMDNCLGNFAEEDGKFLRYSAYNLNPDTQVGETFNNGLDDLFTYYSGKAASIFLYGNATNVANGSGNANLFINEDAVLLQSGSDAINATVGITFDNSDHGQNAYDYYGNKLEYDWHFMSTPLSNASTGATYGQENGNHGNVNLSNMTDGYFPNSLTPMDGAVKWDFYTYYEPEYHWINLKRTDHFHIDGGAPIEYTEDDNKTEGATFIPGKGYMMAISQDSYMSNSGVLNNGDVTITLTNGEPQSLQYNKGWNLVGNPYQAYLDVSSLGTIYGYDADMGVYAPYSTSASVNPAIPAQNIHPHQAFFYHAATDGATLTFTPTMATTTEDPNSYFRAERVNYPLVNLFAENAAGNRDLAVVELNRPELGGATKVGFMTNANFQIAAHLDGENYGLLFTPENTEKVPVRFYTDEDGTFTLTWSTFNGNFTSLLLVDNMTGTITDMLHSDHYTFDATTSDYASRFYLTYACTGVDEYNEGDGSFAFFDGSEWVVNGKGQLDVIDVTGRVLFSKRIANERNRVNLNNVAPGVYMMRVSDGKDTMVQKIVVR